MKTEIQLLQPELWPITVDWDLRFSRPQAQKALAYWRSLLGGRLMPARQELTPRAMKAFITYVNLVDVLSLGDDRWDYVISLQSADARAVLGDIKGRRLAEIFPPAVERRWRSSFDLPRAGGAPVRLLTRASTGNKNWLACEVLLAPLGEREEVDSIFWVTVSWVANSNDANHLLAGELRQH
jgi:hypothetical protein